MLLERLSSGQKMDGRGATTNQQPEGNGCWVATISATERIAGSLAASSLCNFKVWSIESLPWLCMILVKLRWNLDYDGRRRIKSVASKIETSHA
jgi:hypothetical protein